LSLNDVEVEGVRRVVREDIERYAAAVKTAGVKSD